MKIFCALISISYFTICGLVFGETHLPSGPSVTNRPRLPNGPVEPAPSYPSAVPGTVYQTSCNPIKLYLSGQPKVGYAYADLSSKKSLVDSNPFPVRATDQPEPHFPIKPVTIAGLNAVPVKSTLLETSQKVKNYDSGRFRVTTNVYAVKIRLSAVEEIDFGETSGDIGGAAVRQTDKYTICFEQISEPRE